MSWFWGRSGSSWTVRWTVRLLPPAVLALVAIGGVLLATSMGSQPVEARSAESDSTFTFTGYVKFVNGSGGILFPGESVDQDHQDWSELLSFDQALLAPPLALGGSGAATGKPQFEDIVLVKRLDRTGPPLQNAAATGRMIPGVVIEFQRWGEGGQVFYEYQLSNVLVTRYNVGTTMEKNVTPLGQPRVEAGSFGSSNTPIEEIALAYSRITVRYAAQKPDGSMDAWTEFSWDLARNRQ